MQRLRQAVKISFLCDAIAAGKADAVRLCNGLHLLAGGIIELAARAGERQVEFFEGFDHVEPGVVFI